MNAPSKTSRHRCLIIGCGYLGSRVAAYWHKAGHEVFVTTRSPERVKTFEAAGYAPVVCDVLDSSSLTQLPEAETVLYSVGFDRSSGHSMRDIYIDGLSNTFTSLKQRCQRLIYISSTSVYGQTDGSIVDEDSICQPSRENGKICLEAEQLLNQNSIQTIILRLAGIYGPDRLLSRIEQRRQNLPIAGNPESWLNLIHVDDAVRAVDAVASQSDVASHYLICDDEPVTRRTYYRHLAELLSAPEPIFESSLTDPKGDRGLNKRCNNQRMHKQLLTSLTYPTISQGLPHAIGLTPEA